MRIINKVENLLRSQPKLRNSDKELLLAVWEQEGFILSEYQKEVFIERCTTAESITRARRHLRAKYPASDKVEDQRFNKYKAYKNDKAVSWL